MSFAGGQMVRGTVTATAADHLTVKTEAGDIYQVAISANTRVTKERQPLKVATSEREMAWGRWAFWILQRRRFMRCSSV